MPIRVEVEIDHSAIDPPDGAVEVVDLAVTSALRREGFNGNQSASVTVLLTSDARLRQLNRDFAGEDHATDVLSFEAHPFDELPAEIDNPRATSIGDIAISMQRTERQALEKGVRFERELALLAVHGALHLLGYDHAQADDERVMFGKTDEVLAEIFG